MMDPAIAADGVAYFRFWRAGPLHGRLAPVRAELADAFDACLAQPGAEPGMSATGAALEAAARATGVRWHRRPRRPAPASPAYCDPLAGAVAISIWRCHDGWLALPAVARRSWRDFCATFLNRSAFLDTAWDSAWRCPAINRLATTILDTHRVRDAVATCAAYGIPAAAVPGWIDDGIEFAPGNLADRLAYAAFVPARGTPLKGRA